MTEVDTAKRSAISGYAGWKLPDKNISYTQTKDGWFLIKEERAPENYKKTYQLANSLDEENYRQYGGREIRMNENGFILTVEQPCIFYDEKEEPKAKVYVKNMISNQKITYRSTIPDLSVDTRGGKVQ